MSYCLGCREEASPEDKGRIGKREADSFGL